MDAEIQKVSLSYSVDNASPSLDVSKTDLSYSLGYINASFAVSYTNTVLDVSYIKAAYEVRYVNMTPTTIEVGLFILRENLAEFFFAQDNTQLTTGKNLVDASSFTDSTQYDFSKQLYDYSAASETLSRRTSKRLRDSGDLSDLDLAIQAGKNIGDSTILTHELRFDTTKYIEEASHASDLFSLSFGRPVLDSWTAAESISIRPRKVFAEVSSASDTSSVLFNKQPKDYGTLSISTSFDVSKSLVDNIFVTDDIDGEASIEDDQTMSFTKVRSELGTFTDLLERAVSYRRTLQELPTLSDNQFFTTGKNIYDAASVVDTAVLRLTIVRFFEDSASSSDNVYLGLTTVISDDGYVQESAVKSFTKGNSDSANVADSGSLYGQDYVDNPFYFAGDYVGYSLTF